MWLRFEYTNFDTVRQKKKNLWQSYCSYLYSCTWLTLKKSPCSATGVGKCVGWWDGVSLMVLGPG